MGIVLFANPTAHSGDAAATIDLARRLLVDRGLKHQFIPTEPAGGTVDRVRRAVNDEGTRLVIYLGGDGTFSEVARGILRSHKRAEVTLGMLPSGTANDQGKSFGLQAGPDALAENVAIIARGATRLIDVGRIERLDGERATHAEYFFDSASIGFSAAVLRTRNADREAVSKVPILGELYRDHAIYTGAAIKHFVASYFEPMKLDVDADLDGRPRHYEGLMDLLVSNTRVWAGAFVLHRQACAEDGLLELAPVGGRRDLTSKLLASFRHGLFDEDDLRDLGLDASKVEQIRRATLTIHARGEPPAIQADGDELRLGDPSRDARYRISVIPRHLRIAADRGELDL
ncbi:MAG: hypothetical protein KAI47_07440 [Deltaproteobacteria bacterium]|nr:hypothetical protein [Deltaproteobacteria bacterium]